MIKPDYELTIRFDSIFGIGEDKAWLKKKTKGWDYWIEGRNKKGMKKVTRGHKYLIGETLELVIANIERGNDYTRRKVTKILPLHKKGGTNEDSCLSQMPRARNVG